jgi:SAM-dependent methyltransferase
MLPTLSEQERQSVAFYDKEIREKTFVEPPVWLDGFSFPIFLDFQTKGTIVDVGCNTGRSIQLFRQMDIADYLGIDPSEEAIKYCRTTFPGYQFEVDEIRTLGKNYPDRFGGFFCAAVLMHLPKTDLGFAIASLRRSMKKGAVGFFANPFDSEGSSEAVNDYGMKLTLFTPEEIREAFISNGFEIRDAFSPDGFMFLGHVVAV